VAGSRWASAAVLLAWCLLAIGDSAHAGYFTGVGLTCIVVGFVLVAAVAAAGVPLAIPDRPLLAIPITVCIVEAIVDPSRRFLYIGGGDLLAIHLLSSVAAVAAAILLVVDGRRLQVMSALVFALAAATGIVTIVLISNPNIDVWDLLQQSSTGLLHGDDMYRQHWLHSTGLQSVYPYLPASTLVLAPFRWVLGDVRYGLLAASLLTAWLLRRHRSNTPPALAALVIVMPDWVYLINRSWTEPLLVLLIAAAIIAMKAGRSTVAVVALAIALASKQPIVLLLPLFALWPSFGLRRVVAACAIAVAIVLPWFIAGPSDLWHDAVHANLNLAVMPNALNLSAVFLRHGTTVDFWLLAIGLVVGYALVLWRVPRSPSGLALGCAIVMWAYNLTNTQTFFNHYVLPLGLLVVALALADRSPEDADRPVLSNENAERSR
jgi:hypothetical protein